ncbi:MAG: benzoyl-CoA reductase, bzd-type, subunit Q, partial [Deltaproteobacteria bacterium]|nr:benzoyl-CoA reductase, bzd-type, subunit Q [Deltaproteobacteria bacterium]
MAEEFWRWKESRWTNPDIDWKTGKIITGGVDVGSVSSQAVIMVDGQLYAYGNTRTGSDSPNSALNA